MFRQAGVNRFATLKELEKAIAASEKKNAAAAKTAEKQRIAAEKSAAEAKVPILKRELCSNFT